MAQGCNLRIVVDRRAKRRAGACQSAGADPGDHAAVTAFAVARERGYYRQEGLDVQLVVMPSGLGTQALLGGNVKFSTAGGAGLMPILRGAPVRFMFTSFSRPMFWLYSRSDIRSCAARSFPASSDGC